MKPAHIHISASVFGFVAVAAGAFGAHFLRLRVSVQNLEIWKTAVFYLVVHAIVTLLAAKIAAYKSCYFFLIGSLIFSGSLFALVLSEATWWGAVTPVGGLLLLVGWVMLAVDGRRSY